MLQYTKARGSHIHDPCKSVCNQNYQRSKPFWGADHEIKVTSKLLINGSRTCGCNSTFDPIKSSNQAHFLSIKKLDRCHKCFNRQHISDYKKIRCCTSCIVHTPASCSMHPNFPIPTEVVFNTVKNSKSNLPNSPFMIDLFLIS